MKKFSFFILFINFMYCFANDSIAINVSGSDSSVFLIYSSDDHQVGYLFKSIRDTIFNNISFIYGYEIREETWMFGKRVFIPAENIKTIISFHSYKDYCSSKQKYYDTTPQKRRKKK